MTAALQPFLRLLFIVAGVVCLLGQDATLAAIAAPSPLATPHLALQLGHNGPALDATFSPDGRLLASSGIDGTVRLWDSTTGVLERTLVSRSKSMYAVTFSPDGRLVAGGSADGLSLWNRWTGALLHTWKGDFGIARFSPDGRNLATANQEGPVQTYNPVTGALIRTFKGTAGRVVAAAFSPDSAILAAGDERGNICLLSVQTDKVIRVLLTPAGWWSDHYLLSLAFTPDGGRLAAGTVLAAHDIQTVGRVTPAGSFLWNVKTGQRLRSFAGSLSSVAFIHDGRVLVGGVGGREGEGEITCWDTGSGKRLRAVHVEGGPVRKLAVSQDGRSLAVVSEKDGRVRLGSLSTGLFSTALPGYTADVFSLAAAPEERLLAATGGYGGVLLWNLNTGSPERRLPVPSSWLQPVVFSADGTKVVSGGPSGPDGCEVRIWNARSGALETTLQAPGRGKGVSQFHGMESASQPGWE